MSEWRYAYGTGWSVDDFAWWVIPEDATDFKDELEQNGYPRYPSWTMGQPDCEAGVEVYARADAAVMDRPRWVVIVDEPGGGGVLVAVNDLPSLLGLLREVEILTRSWRDMVVQDGEKWLDSQLNPRHRM